MTEILTNLGCLWGRRGSLSSTSSSRTLGRIGNFPNFNDFKLHLGGSWRPSSPEHQPLTPTSSFKLAKTALCRGLGQASLSMVVEELSKVNRFFFLLAAIPRISDEYFQRSQRFNENKIISGSGLILREFRPHGSSRIPSRSKVSTLVLYCSHYLKTESCDFK